MRKLLVIAAREYNATVRTKAFLLSLVLMPVLMGGTAVVHLLLKDWEDTREKRFAVVDRTAGEQLYPALAAAARRRNATQIFDPETGRQIKPAFALERVAPSADTPNAVRGQRFELSEQVRRREYFGFLEIGPDVLHPTDPGPAADAAGPIADRAAVRYQSHRATYHDFPRWAEKAVNEAIRDRRGAEAGLGREQLRALQRPVSLVPKGLATRHPATGAIDDGRDVNVLASMLLPTGLAMMMFLMIFVGATPLMQGVVEEKMQRIAEVLLGSVRPFALMLGKLLGTVGVALTLAAVYLGGACWGAQRYGYADYVSAEVLAWFVVFQTLGVLLYGALFIAIGAACTNTQEAQALLMPVTLLAVLPLFVLLPVIQEPDGALATACSLFPPAAPLLMVVRLAIPPGLPLWQPVLGAVLVLATTLVCVYAAGRIFRVGLLRQGKGASAGDLVRWVLRG
jgi:ABC-2 type transport system permease protein